MHMAYKNIYGEKSELLSGREEYRLPSREESKSVIPEDWGMPSSSARDTTFNNHGKF